MKIIDLEVADVKYCFDNDITDEIRNFKFHQKYLFLDFAHETKALEIIKVTDDAFYLKIK